MNEETTNNEKVADLGGQNERIVMPEFGELIKVTSKLIRRQKTEYKGDKKRPVTVKYWKECGFNGSGIFLGTRTLQNGERHYDSDYGYYFAAQEHIKVALVSPSARQNPIYVPLHAIEA